MNTHLNLETWPRRQQYEFFRGFDQPYFGICAEVEVSELCRHVRARGASFTLAYLYLSTRAANAVEPFRYRLDGEQVRVYERIHASCTVLLEDERFVFTYFDFYDDFARFEREGRAAITAAQRGDAPLDPRAEQDDLIHYSALPWISFTGISHARDLSRLDSVPKITFGKVVERSGTERLPISVEAHHALMDGLHVARYLELFEGFCADPATSLGG